MCTCTHVLEAGTAWGAPSLCLGSHQLLVVFDPPLPRVGRAQRREAPRAWGSGWWNMARGRAQARQPSLLTSVASVGNAKGAKIGVCVPAAKSLGHPNELQDLPRDQATVMSRTG